MSIATKPEPRGVIRKVVLNDDENLALLRACARMGMQASPAIRQLINGWTGITRPNRRPARRERAWPAHGPVVALPNRAAYGGAPKPMRL